MLCISVLNQTKISVKSISFRSLRCLDTAAETQLFLAVNIFKKPVVYQSILFALKQDFVQEHSRSFLWWSTHTKQYIGDQETKGTFIYYLY